MLVVDASCLYEVVAGGSGAEVIRQRLASDAEQVAPHIVDVEVFNVVRREYRAGRLDNTAASQAIEDLQEIGVRIALGADPGAVTGLVIGGGLRLAVAGVVIGAAAAAGTTRLLGSMLYGVSPADPLTFVAIAVLVAAIALLASYVPARRALRINPTEALRAD